MMRVLIIEDEPLSAGKIRDYLARYDDSIQVITMLDSVTSAIQWFSRNDHPDLVFLDIHLSDGICFSIFEQVDVQAPVIFTTAHDKYALKAFELNSIDYLLKPIKYDAVAAAMQKLRNLTGEASPDDLTRRIQGLMESLKETKGQYRERFLVKSGNRIRSVETGQIAYFYSESKMSFLVTRDNHRYVLDSSLDMLQRQLDPKSFFRANRKLLVKFDALKAIHPFFKGRLKIELQPDFRDEIIISSEKAQTFKEWLDQ